VRRTTLAIGFVLSGIVITMAVASRVSAQAPAAGTVLVAEYDGIIHPISAEFFEDFMTRADTSGAALAVLILRTPGGLLESTRTMVSRMIAARTPVVVFVAPSGSRAASAGFILTLAADVAAMAPGTHIGAAHPVSASGQDDRGEEGDNPMRDKAASDTAAYARTLAVARHRNVELAEEAVLNSRAFTEQEALAAKPPLIDVVAGDLPALLAALDGRRVTRFDGAAIILQTDNRAIERMSMTRRQQMLSAIAHPQIAYLLLSLGMLGLVVELWNPGAIAPGVIGGICLLLAFFAFQILPINVTGVLLLVLGLGLLVVEVMVPSFGVLGVGGIIALAAGSVMVTTELPGVRVNYALIGATALATAAIVLGLGRLAMRAQQLAPATGVAAMIGEPGRALTDILPGATGQVGVHGEIWRATSGQPIAQGAPVRVVGIEGLTLGVELVDAAAEEGDTT
jgi:membrane-bound serine protease (ClpP class)